mgnify:CR=1 FL=1
MLFVSLLYLLSPAEGRHAGGGALETSASLRTSSLASPFVEDVLFSQPNGLWLRLADPGLPAICRSSFRITVMVLIMRAKGAIPFLFALPCVLPGVGGTDIGGSLLHADNGWENTINERMDEDVSDFMLGDDQIETVDASLGLDDLLALVIVLTLVQPLVYVGLEGNRVVGRRLTPSHGRVPAVEIARRLCARLLPNAGSPEVILAGENAQLARVVAVPLDALTPRRLFADSHRARRKLVRRGLTFGFVSLAAIRGLPVEEIATAAVVCVTSFIRPSAQLSTLATGGRLGTATFRLGKVEMQGLAIQPSLQGTAGSYRESVLANCRLASRSIQSLLLDGGGAGSHEAWLAEECRALADRVAPAPHAQVPSDLLDSLPRFDYDWIEERAFARPLPAVVRPFLERKPLQVCEAAPPGATLQDLVEPGCWANWTRCERRHLNDLIKVSQGPAVSRIRPRACAYAYSCLSPRYRGCIWDLRDPAGATPVDFHREQPTHLNLDFYEREMVGHPDQELLSMMRHGVRFQADIAQQFVIMPPLLSLSNAFPSVQKEFKRLADKPIPWVVTYDQPPFWPMRASPQGTTPRKYELNRDRRISDASAPEKELFDSDGVPVVALNVASAAPRRVGAELLGIPKEHKPTLRMVMRDLSILLCIAAATNEPVYLFTDDMADYFNQLRLAPEDEWKSVVVTLAQEGDPGYDARRPSLVYVNERVLGFGTLRSSNYAQRHTNLLMEVHQRRALADDRRISYGHSSQRLRRLLAKRRALGEKTGQPEDRRFTNHCYTDDCIFAAIGEAGTISSLRTWRSICREINLLMAIPKKREIGTMVIWLGILIFSMLGVAVVTTEKLMRAYALVSTALSGTLAWADWQRMCGMLEHIRCINCMTKLSNFGMYAAHSLRLGASDVVELSPLNTRALTQWLRALQRTGGAVFLVAFRTTWTGVGATMMVFTSSDAAMLGTLTPGLGGYCNGLFWYYPLSAEELRYLVIGVLELLAAVCNIILLWPRLQHLPAVAHACDALATPLVLAAHSAKSPVMQATLVAACENATYHAAAQSGKWATGHLFGDANVAADLVSRGHWERFSRLLAQLRVRPEQVQVNDACRHIIGRALQAARAASVAAADASLAIRRRRVMELPGAASRPADTLPRYLFGVENIEFFEGSSRPVDLLPKYLFGNEVVEFVSSWTALFTMCDPDERRAARLARARLPGKVTKEKKAAAPSPTLREKAKGSATAQKAKALVSAYDGQALRSTPVAEAAAENLTRSLLHDDSEFALRPDDPAAFRATAAVISKFIHSGVAEGTRKVDALAWRRHEAWCKRHNTPAARTQKAMEEFPLREAYRECSTLLETMQSIKPRSKDDAEAKPRSGLNTVLGIRRVLGYSGVISPKFKLLRIVLKGMNRACMRVHGKDFLLAKRKEPIPDRVSAACKRIEKGTVIGAGMVASKDCADYEMLLDAISVLEDTGLRKAEIVLNAAEDPLITLTWGDVAWRLGEKVNLFPSKADLRRARKGLIKASLLITPPNSKCDATGETWGNKPIPIPYDSEPHNAVHRISRRWTRLGVGKMSLEERKRTPVFVDVKTGQAYTPARMDILHNALLKYVCGQLGEPKLAKLFSVHSYRIRLATRLRSAGARDSRIQAYCRWLCPESLHIYARWDYDDYEKWIRKARTCPVQVGETRNLPALSNAEDLKSAQALLARKKKLKAPTKVEQLGVTADDDTSAVATAAAEKPSKARQPAVSRAPPTIQEQRAPLAKPCNCGGSHRLFDKPLPAGFTATWRHAKRRCYWHFLHPTHGAYHSFKQLTPFAALQPPATPRDNVTESGELPPSSAPVGRRASRKRKRHEASEPRVVDRSPSPQTAAASPTPTELETETLVTAPAPPKPLAEPSNAPTCEDTTYLCRCVREIDGALCRCLCLTDDLDDGWCEDCYVGRNHGWCECECDTCGWQPEQPALSPHDPLALPPTLSAPVRPAPDPPNPFDNPLALPPPLAQPVRRGSRELRNLQPSTGVRVASRGDAIVPKYDPNLERAQRGTHR